MRRFTPTKLKDFLSAATLTGGFTLISIGVGTIFGTGAGELAGGASLLTLQWWLTKTG